MDTWVQPGQNPEQPHKTSSFYTCSLSKHGGIHRGCVSYIVIHKPHGAELRLSEIHLLGKFFLKIYRDMKKKKNWLSKVEDEKKDRKHRYKSVDSYKRHPSSIFN